jgi:hypothetical protein
LRARAWNCFKECPAAAAILQHHSSGTAPSTSYMYKAEDGDIVVALGVISQRIVKF